MIGSLIGRVKKKARNYLIVDVNGVGYKVFVPYDLLSTATENFEINLFTHLYVREDKLALYGFKEEKELNLFESLLSVSGIGPKMALGILSQAKVEEIEAAVANADATLFQSVSGIGKKNAHRIIIDLQAKLGKLEDLDLAEFEAQREVIEALRSLGYTVKEARSALKEVDSKLPTEVQIREALRKLSVK